MNPQFPQNQIEILPLAGLKAYPNNPRTHPPANVTKLVQSLQQYGWTNPVLITDSNEIIAGHGRVLAAVKLGLLHAPCIRLSHLTPEQVKTYRIADNRLGLDSDWDDELLRLELSGLDLDSVLTGFDEAELERILNATRAGEDDVTPLQETAVSKLGDIWALGPHRLLCGDATDAQAVLRLLAGVSPNLMVTDPPYGVEYDASWREDRDLGIGERSKARVLNDDRSDWREAYILFPGNIAYVWHASWYTSTVQESLLASGFKIRFSIIWVKQHFTIGRGDYHWQHEPCWYATKGKSNWRGGRTQTTVWSIPNNNPFGGQGEEKFGLSVQKPVECMRRPILNHTSEGQAVYDPFMGSGTTIIASETIGRVCYGIEINPLYVDMAIHRWQTFTGKTATRLTDNTPFDG